MRALSQTQITLNNRAWLPTSHSYLLRDTAPGGTSGKESACQCRRHKRYSFDPWVGKIPWSRKWPPTPVFLPGKSHGQSSLVGYSPQGRRVRHNWVTSLKGQTLAFDPPYNHCYLMLEEKPRNVLSEKNTVCTFFPTIISQKSFSTEHLRQLRNRLRVKVTWYIRKRNHQRQKSAKPIQILPEEMVTWCSNSVHCTLGKIILLSLSVISCDPDCLLTQQSSIIVWLPMQICL